MTAWAKQNNGDYLNPITGHWWKKEGDKWQLYEEYGRYQVIAVSEEDFKEIEKQLKGGGSDARLRDRFAMAALSGLLASSDTSWSPSKCAEWSYMHADEMLKEREK